MNTESVLSVLLGASCSLEASSDSLLLRAENGWTLSIFSKHELRVPAEREVASGLGRQCLQDVRATESLVQLFFSDGEIVVVDLSDDGYLGPEAMVLSGPNAEFIVWN